MKRLFSVFFAITAIPAILFAQTEIEEADSAYIQGDYMTAASLYESVLKTQGESASLYMNLGNSYFKMDQIALAILNYERASLLDPSDSDIRFNLELARTKTVDNVTSSGDIFYVAWFKKLVHMCNINTWAVLSLVFLALMAVGFLLYVFMNSMLVKKISFSFGAVFFVFSILTFIFATAEKTVLKSRDSAIIMAPSVTVKSTPSENGTELFIIHEGRKVKVTDSSMKEWVEIKLDDGNSGWIPVSAMETI